MQRLLLEFPSESPKLLILFYAYFGVVHKLKRPKERGRRKKTKN